MDRRTEDAHALAVGRAVLGLLAALGLVERGEPAMYDADRLPPGLSRDAFLRRHRARVREGIPGWTRAGKARLVSREAWERDVADETCRPRHVAVPRTVPRAANDLDAELDAALGIRTRR
jgi:hypothetical protein